MFNNPRYITKGINNTVPFALQLLMWNMIDTMEISHKDCLQVFELSEENGKQKMYTDKNNPYMKRRIRLIWRMRLFCTQKYL